MMGEKIVVRVEHEVERCFGCPYCVQDHTTIKFAGECSCGKFKIDNIFQGVHKDCPFRKENQK